MELWLTKEVEKFKEKMVKETFYIATEDAHPHTPPPSAMRQPVLSTVSPRFSECAELLNVCWLDIGCSIASRMLSDNTIYAAYLVFKMADDVYGLDSPLQEAWISVGGTSSSRPVRLESYVNNEEDVVISGEEEAPQVVQIPRGRADGWMELEIGEFYTEQGDDGEVRASLKETNGGNWKRGLIVQGIEFRPKK